MENTPHQPQTNQPQLLNLHTKAFKLGAYYYITTISTRSPYDTPSKDNVKLFEVKEIKSKIVTCLLLKAKK